MIEIEFRYADSNQQFICSLMVAENTSVQQLIPYVTDELQKRSIKSDNLQIGINGILVKNYAQIVKEYDLLEIYQPLLIDPKQLRIIKAKRKKTLN